MGALPEDPRSLYASRVLERYGSLPGTLCRALNDDRRLALDLHDRGISLDLLDDAFVLAVARRSLASDPASLGPIRSLRYFLPVIHELLTQPPPPGYIRYLRAHLDRSAAQPSR